MKIKKGDKVKLISAILGNGVSFICENPQLCLSKKYGCDFKCGNIYKVKYVLFNQNKEPLYVLNVPNEESINIENEIIVNNREVVLFKKSFINKIINYFTK